MAVHIPEYMYTRGIKLEQRKNDEMFECITRQIWTLENFTVTQQAHPIILCIHLVAATMNLYYNLYCTVKRWPISNADNLKLG